MLWKNAKEKNAEKKIWNQRIQIYTNFKIFVVRFSIKMAHHFLLSL